MGDGPISYAIPLTIELLGIIIVAIGLGVEVYRGADAGFMLISIGSFLIAAGSCMWTKLLKSKKGGA